MPYINFSDDDLYRANTADLVSYLERRGERMKRVGSTYSSSTFASGLSR